MFEPITLPVTISDVPLNTEAIEVASSGNDVPKATIVTPIIKGEIPKDSPIFSALSINLSEAQSKTTKLTTNKPTYVNNPKIFYLIGKDILF